MKLPDGTGTHRGVPAAQRAEDERGRPRLRAEAETVAWALKKGELIGMKWALSYTPFPSVTYQTIKDRIAEFEAELEAGTP